jgi:hypothetical protein
MQEELQPTHALAYKTSKNGKSCITHSVDRVDEAIRLGVLSSPPRSTSVSALLYPSNGKICKLETLSHAKSPLRCTPTPHTSFFSDGSRSPLVSCDLERHPLACLLIRPIEDRCGIGSVTCKYCSHLQNSPRSPNFSPSRCQSTSSSRCVIQRHPLARFLIRLIKRSAGSMPFHMQTSLAPPKLSRAFWDPYSTDVRVPLGRGASSSDIR